MKLAVIAYLLVCFFLPVQASTPSFEETFGLDLFDKGKNKVRLGMFSNESGDTSSWSIDFKLNKDIGIGQPSYPNKDKDQFILPTTGPVFTMDELLAIGQNDYSDLSDIQKERLFAAIDHSVDDYSVFHINLSAEGLLALDKEKNLKDFTQFRAQGTYKKWRDNQYTYGGGIFATYETDQSNDNAQIAYGVSVNAQFYFHQGKANEYVFLKLDYAQVDPTDNTQRLAILNGDKSTFHRWEMDATVQFQISVQEIDKVELSYRYFYEPGAPTEVAAAGMNNFALFTAGIFFQKGWFIAFSDGELPFSVQKEQIVELGWSHSFN
ncbi:hypothetical protein [Paraglaciecola sp.]|uniref:hypothetical protein n=1 Tax=Paraglaciecola sp. TaxID=1920173 RepID=UPI0030F37D50